ncbi:recombinase family protein [Thiocystis violacea]|uniref:recombinase family protein n=1 Tax=Thiocystis violacea TaxID=13725 RepID=UPI0019041607|nr:recombinase family protein [Thiocystis violacea]MBK1720273.1 transposase [Thiocystis violacea]
MNSFDAPSKVTTTHQAKPAYVYIRQSSPGQVTRHAESTELQYRLVERAVALGWPRDRIQVVDEDLGKSGTSAEQRSGFQHLIAEIGLGQVGLVLSLDASRLARNNSDWCRLVELCSLFGTLLADGEQLYDPRQYHDRLLLGLSGIMSEAELHQLKIRLQAGEYQKAERGELHLSLPVGLERLREGTIVLNPDEEVQARLRLVFQKFEELGSARAVLRDLHRTNLPLPTRPLRGPAPHEILWQPASASRVLAILHNPAYAGAYVYGQTTRDPTRRQPGHPQSGLVRRPLAHWPVCLPDVYPAYISWERFLATQQQLQDNQNRYQADRHGVPRQGQALLQGLIRCGRCGALMQVRYSGPDGQYPVYRCAVARHEYNRPRCQEVRALALDAEIERHLLKALEPDQLALALATLEQFEQENAALQHQWQLRLEHARYDSERAWRQYNGVEPEHRLVARTLERQWEDKLRVLEELEHAHQRWASQHAINVTEADRQAILALAEDVPHLWHAPTTTPADRKRLLRLVVQSVVVDAKAEPGCIRYRIVWQTGAASNDVVRRNVQSYREYPRREELQSRVQMLSAVQKTDADIAVALNAEGFQTARGRLFSGKLVWLLRRQWQIPAIEENGNEPNPPRWTDGTYSVEGVAEAVGVTVGTVYHWVRRGQVDGHQMARGMPWKILLTPNKIDELKCYVQRVRRTNRSQKEAV